MGVRIYGAARQAAKQEPRHVYPLWGDWKRPESNARKFYRNGDVCAWCRYIVKPRDGILWYGWTVGDTVTTFAVVAFLWLLAQAIGFGVDGYLDAMGW